MEMREQTQILVDAVNRSGACVRACVRARANLERPRTVTAAPLPRVQRGT
jgi:pyrimidine operon attenuation protein/uracil phosphoribosyltransferase